MDLKRHIGYPAFMETKIDPKILEDPLFQQLVAEGLAIQDHFSAEPIYAKTGKGYLKSAGVEELRATNRTSPRDCRSSART